MLCFALLFASCDHKEKPTDASAEAVAEIVLEALPPLAVAEGDGLPETLPQGLVWETNDSDSIFADPGAVRGGTLRSYITSFPLTLRRVGPDSNGSFARVTRANQLSPVAVHPETGRVIPQMANEWAFGSDGRTIFYRLNKAARWSDGVPVTADDYVFTVQFMRSKSIMAPWYNNYYAERIRDVKKYDNHTIGVQGADAKPGVEMHANYAIGPTPRHFHRLSEQWTRETNWAIEPNTGPYQITKVEKGKYIELTRKADWWADDLKYYKQRFNPEKIRYRVIRDVNAAWQHSLKAELDTFGLVLPNFWHDKVAEATEFSDGYIDRYWFYNDLPTPSGGFFLNVANPLLADRNTRYGLAHSMNFDRVIRTVLRGDFERLPTFQLGFGEYDNRDIQPRNYDLDRAVEYFKGAGFAKRDAEGIWVKDDGTRLSLRVTYGATHHTERLGVLKEEARKAGVELILRLIDSAAAFKQMQEKKHDIAWMTWGTGGLSPRYWEHFHSDNANKPQTNNITNHANPEMDVLIMEYRASSGFDERVRLARTLEAMVHESGVFIPSFHVPYTREGAWRWVKLPEHMGTRRSGSLFNPFGASAGYSSGGLFWIDTEEKKRVLEARENGETFEPVLIEHREHRRAL